MTIHRVWQKASLEDLTQSMAKGTQVVEAQMKYGPNITSMP